MKSAKFKTDDFLIHLQIVFFLYALQFAFFTLHFEITPFS